MDIPAPNWHKKYDFAALQSRGDKLFMPFESEVNLASLRSAAHQWAKRHGFQVVTRRDAGGVTVYRVT